MYELRLDLEPILKSAELISRKDIKGAESRLSGLGMTQVGSRRALFRTKGLEFEKYKDFVTGDDATMIDWKASLRAQKILSRVYSEEENKDIVFLLDVSSSMSYSSFGKLKNEYAAELIAALTYSFSHTGDNIGLYMFTDKITRVVSLDSGPGQYKKVLSALTDPTNYEGSYDLGKTLRELYGILKRKAVIVIVSDFIGLKEGWKGVVLSSTGIFEILAFIIRDPLDDKLPEKHVVGQLVISDPFSEEEILTDPHKIRERYEEYNKKSIKNIETVFRSISADILVLHTNESFVKPLRKFLLIG